MKTVKLLLPDSESNRSRFVVILRRLRTSKAVSTRKWSRLKKKLVRWRMT